MIRAARLPLLLPVTAAVLSLTSCKGTRSEEPTTEIPDSTVATVSYEQLEKANWLLGTWKDSSQYGTTSESWEKINDSTFSGSASFTANGEVLSSEDLLLEERDGQLFYVPTVHNQNEGEPVRFLLTTATENELVFENPEHDFPQMIRYTRVNEDSIVAEISGTYEGQQSVQPFPMKRAK